MSTEYKFVHGRGDNRQEKEMNEAGKEGFEVRQMAVDLSLEKPANNLQIVVLMEKQTPSAEG